jgi:hypothetical protein
MKTGKLMKFKHPAGEVQAYLYQDADVFRASLYVMDGRTHDREPVHTLVDPSEEALLAEIRAWVEAHYPRPR